MMKACIPIDYYKNNNIEIKGYNINSITENDFDFVIEYKPTEEYLNKCLKQYYHSHLQLELQEYIEKINTIKMNKERNKEKNKRSRIKKKLRKDRYKLNYSEQYILK